MTEQTFKNFLKELCLYFDRKHPSEETGMLWFMEIQHIPDYDLAAIQQRIKQLEWPKYNFPGKILELWKSTRKEPEEDFLIKMVKAHARDHGAEWDEAFYDLRGSIKLKNVGILPTVRWLQGNGYKVDLRRLKEPTPMADKYRETWKSKFISKIGEMPFDTSKKDEVPF